MNTEDTEFQEIPTEPIESPKNSTLTIVITIGVLILTVIGIAILKKTTTKQYTRQEVIDKIKDLLDKL